MENEKENFRLNDNQLKNVSGGIEGEVSGDVEKKIFTGKIVPMPEPKSKKDV